MKQFDENEIVEVWTCAGWQKKHYSHPVHCLTHESDPRQAKERIYVGDGDIRKSADVALTINGEPVKLDLAQVDKIRDMLKI